MLIEEISMLQHIVYKELIEIMKTVLLGFRNMLDQLIYFTRKINQ